uniref:Uncharacterized protein n=1 Tax=Cacopsylla melanoneura TaxID=428564 RepID=A0A8D8W4T5_9HEMI
MSDSSSIPTKDQAQWELHQFPFSDMLGTWRLGFFINSYTRSEVGTQKKVVNSNAGNVETWIFHEFLHKIGSRNSMESYQFPSSDVLGTWRLGFFINSYTRSEVGTQ